MKTKKTIYNTSFKCLVCSKEVSPLEKTSLGLVDIFETLENVIKFHATNTWLSQDESSFKTRQPGNVGNELVHDGMIDYITFGYGSSHNGDVFIIAMCDDCVMRKKEEGLLIFDHNSMWPEEADE